MALIREHPEYLTLSEGPPTKQMRTMPLSAGNTTVSSTANTSVMNTPLATDAGSGTESQADRQRSLQRSPTFAPTSSPKLSPLELYPSTSYDQDEEKEVDMLEDDILNDLDTKPTMSPRQKAYLTDADYLNLLPIRERLQKSVRDLDRDMSGFTAKVDANSNIVVKQMLEAASKQRAEIVTELDKVNAKIVALESS
uniref:Uncharacterized protein n=1 Tax=Hyaloperonospora arabidopsidis (strain Emoy2) TaxID=559515 RepID=M4BJZ8_HYAAE